MGGGIGYEAVLQKMADVARLYHFTISDLSNLYLDAEDEQGLEFWHKDARAYEKELKKSMSSS